MRLRPLAVFIALLAGGGMAGCSGGGGPELASVDGHVHSDGQPLPGASVIFIPENGSPSYGTTDEAGYYTLSYSINKEGAIPGRHKVQISTSRSADEDADGGAIPSIPEKLPEQYNHQTTLTAEVKPGTNTIDFKDLKSEGKIVQPPKDDQ